MEFHVSKVLTEMDYQIELFNAINFKYKYRVNNLHKQNSSSVKYNALKEKYLINFVNKTNMNKGLYLVFLAQLAVTSGKYLKLLNFVIQIEL